MLGRIVDLNCLLFKPLLEVFRTSVSFLSDFGFCKTPLIKWTALPADQTYWSCNMKVSLYLLFYTACSDSPQSFCFFVLGEDLQREIYLTFWLYEKETPLFCRFKSESLFEVSASRQVLNNLDLLVLGGLTRRKYPTGYRSTWHHLAQNKNTRSK